MREAKCMRKVHKQHYACALKIASEPGMEINTRHTPFAGGFVWWRVNCVTSLATVAGNTFQSGPIKFAYLIHSLYGAAQFHNHYRQHPAPFFFYASFAELQLSISGIISVTGLSSLTRSA